MTAKDDYLRQSIYATYEGLEENWFKDGGNNHNPLGPASTYYEKNGLKSWQSYVIDGRWHRIDGPASCYFRSNDIIQSYFYLLGKPYDFHNWIERVKYDISEDTYLTLKKQYG